MKSNIQFHGLVCMILLAGCSPSATSQTATAAPAAVQSPATATALPVAASPTSQPVPTSFAPVGFSIGPLGLLRDPSTGLDVLGPDSKADWSALRQRLIEGLWSANVDWADYTGESNDAAKYGTKEAFVEAALQGQTFELGIPVRMDDRLIPKEDTNIWTSRERFVVMKLVDVQLAKIQLQVLAPVVFRQYAGSGWTDSGQEAYDSGLACIARCAPGAALFSATDGILTLSVGSLNFAPLEQSQMDPKFLVGNFDPEFYRQYPTRYRPDGIGKSADVAASWVLAMAVDELSNFAKGHYEFKSADGSQRKVISIQDASSILLPNPMLFLFVR